MSSRPKTTSTGGRWTWPALIFVAVGGAGGWLTGFEPRWPGVLAGIVVFALGLVGTAVVAVQAASEAPARPVHSNAREGDGAVEDLEDILGELWLYVNWRYTTKQLTTVQKERWLAAVEAWHNRLDPSEPLDVAAEAWWRPGYVEPLGERNR